MTLSALASVAGCSGGGIAYSKLTETTITSRNGAGER